MANIARTSKSAEEVVSMFLGLVIVMVVFGLVINFFQKRRGSVSIPGSEISETQTDMTGAFDAEGGVNGDLYTVEEGDSLWKIAQSRYNSGYKWVEIAKENGLISPNLLAVGQELKLPAVEVGVAEAGVTIEGGEYQVERGDCLWDIAVRAYGDGYAWTKVWQANRAWLNSPDLLEIGMTLAIPRG